MTTGGKIAVASGLVLIAGVSIVLYRNMRKKTPDDLSISFSKIDGKTADYTLKRNGKYWSSGKIIWREDLVGKQGSDGISDGKNSLETRHLNGYKSYVYLESLDKKFPVGLIDFVKKTYTEK